jgi:hypothetical protein
VPKAEILLRTALVQGSSLETNIKDRLGALKPAHRKHIAIAERSRIGDSLDLDEASRKGHNQENRWDYLLSVPASKRLIAMEPHSAKDSEVSVVIAKKRASTQYLQAHLLPKHRISEWFWVASGSVGFSIMDKATRQLDSAGITFAGKVLRSL